jgi:hypothetical protein
MIARPVPHADLDPRTEAELVRARLRQRPDAIAHGESCDRASLRLWAWTTAQRRARRDFIRQGGLVPTLPLALPAPRAAQLEV